MLVKIEACKDSCSVKFSTSSPYFQASFVGAMAIADLVKTTLGPKGMVKLCLCRMI